MPAGCNNADAFSATHSPGAVALVSFVQFDASAGHQTCLLISLYNQDCLKFDSGGGRYAISSFN